MVVTGYQSKQNFSFVSTDHLDAKFKHALRSIVYLFYSLADNGNFGFADRVPKDRLKLIVHHFVPQIVEALCRVTLLHKV
jgi:hypothetical protein